MQFGRLLTGFLLALAVAAAVVVAASGMPWPRSPLPPRDGPRLADARSWGYQLQRFDARVVPDDVDVVVIDYSRDGSEARVLTPGTIEALRRRDGRPPRIVLCYLSIGEAESYRYYWRPRWQVAPPEWLGPENPQWQGNFAVRYWQAGWRRTIFAPAPRLADHVRELLDHRRRPYIDRILEAGFDGIYLDRVDAFAQWLDKRASAPSDMVALVQDIAAYARSRKPGFLVVAQNGEELLKSPAYLKTLDGVAKEDLLYGVDGEGKENSSDDVAASVELLDRARVAGLPVFVVEYIADPARRAKAAGELRAHGYLPLFAPRGLSLPPESATGSSVGAPPRGTSSAPR